MRKDIDLLLAIVRDTRRYRDRIVYICFLSLFPTPCADSENYLRAMNHISKNRPLVFQRIKALASSRTAS